MPQEGKEAVQVTPLEKVSGVDPETWPSGEVFVRGIELLGLAMERKSSENNPKYWQASARWALLKKYGYLSDADSEPSFCEKSDFVSIVTSLWMSHVVSVSATGKDPDNPPENDLMEFMRNGGTSRGRKMQFDVMTCEPGCQFNLHAHPNLEVVFCARGDLHEVRMEGPPVPNHYDPHPTEVDRVKGPNLTSMRRPWKFGTLREGSWLVNEAGSIHKSFTATSGSGCGLLTLWSGGHANILEGEEPVEPDVLDAVDQMDREIGGCTCSSDWQMLQQTFLPASERRT